MTQPLFIGRQRPDRRATDIEYRVTSDQPLSPNGTRPGADPTSAQGRSRLGLHNDGQLVFGRVVDLVAYARTYKVQCERGLGTLRCTETGQTGFGLVGPRQVNTYPVGTGVLVLHHPQALYGIIICAVPDWAYDARHAVSDMLVQGSNVGLQCDAVHQYPFTTQAGGGVVDWSAGRPTDSLSNEWGAITETGLRVFLDSFMAQFGCDEETAVTAFYFDQLLRVAGHNLQVRSAGYEREDADDESEFSSYEGYTPYPWEALGTFSPGATASVELSAATTQQTANNRSRLEPVSDDQLALHRVRAFQGYLGQGGRREILVPVQGAYTLHRYTDPADGLLGVFSEHLGLDGALGIRSAHSVFIAKAPLQPLAKRRRRAEDPSGDNTTTNYKSCGISGSGPAHLPKAQPDNANTDVPSTEAAAVLDQLAFAFNWKGLHPFHYHAGDWYLPEETDLEQYATVATAIIPFGNLATNNLLPAAPAYTVQVDDRYGLVEYYANLSHVALLPGGGISIVDGWGSEIRMTGGDIYEFAAGDLFKAAGRNVVQWAGWDAIIEGNNSVEVVANKHDVRIKAEDKVLVLGGNNGCGGILLESRATSAAFQVNMPTAEDVISGIVLRAKHTTAAILAKDIYLTTDAWSAPGRIILDAGAGSIVSYAEEHRRHIVNCALDIFNGTTVNEYWPTQTRLSADLVVKGKSYLWGCTTVKGDLVVDGVVQLNDLQVVDAATLTRIATDNADITGRNLSTQVAQSLIELTWLINQSDIEQLEFYFRTPTLANTSDFKLHEPIWHQLARYTSLALPTVQKQTVTGDNHAVSASYPGYSVWFSDTAYGLQPLALYDPAACAAAARGAAYETATLGTVSWVNLENLWPVVKAPA
jgi:hypothetical protein